MVDLHFLTVEKMIISTYFFDMIIMKFINVKLQRDYSSQLYVFLSYLFVFKVYDSQTRQRRYN